MNEETAKEFWEESTSFRTFLLVTPATIYIFLSLLLALPGILKEELSTIEKT